jgi:excisionase family DNA binding protein
MDLETVWEQSKPILSVDNEGLACLEDASGRRYAFTFDKIRGYHGETAREIGLRVGAHVYFEASGDQILWVDLSSAPVILTVPEVARCLRVSERLVYNMIKRGELAHIRIGRLMRIPAEALRLLVDPNSDNARPFARKEDRSEKHLATPQGQRTGAPRN